MAAPAPVSVLVVASWYPAVDDAAKGRFVADQVAALAASGRAIPTVASFEPLPLIGGATARTLQAATIDRRRTAALAGEWADSSPFALRAFSVPTAAPIVRLPIADGLIPAAGAASAEQHRSAALVALGDRLVSTGHRPALIHAHTGFPDGIAASAMAARLGCPLVITEHATFLDRIFANPIQRERYAAGAAAAARVIAVSELLANQIRTELPEIAARIVVIPNAVAVDDFRAVAAADRDPDELLYVGYRRPIKGIDTLLAAFAQARANRSGLRLRLIGRSATSEVEAGWRRLADELGVAESVAFEDVTDRAGVVAAMSRAALLVHASRYETFGVVVAEALSAGLPVVATDSGGVREVLGPDPAAFGAMVAVDDPAAFAAAIEATLARRATFDPEVLRASVIERFAAAVVASRLLEVYDEVLAEAGAPGEPSTPTAWPSSAATGLPRTVVGLDRRRTAASIATLPADVRQSLTVVTAVEPRSEAIAGVGRLIELAVAALPEPAARRASTGRPVIDRLIRFALDPIGTIRRRRATYPLDPRSIATLAVRVREAVGEAPGPWLPLDGRDALVVDALESGEHGGGAPSDLDGLWGLADRWWSNRD